MTEESFLQKACVLAESIPKRISDMCPEVTDFVFSNWFRVLAGGIAIYVVSSRVRGYVQRKRKLSKIEAKRQKFLKKKQHLEKLLRQNPNQELVTKERKEILDLGINELVQKLRSGDLDPLAVMEAYQARSLEATEETNCIVEYMDEARDEAVALRKVPLDQRGPLFGIPFSVKECFFVKGYDSTAGLSKFINMPVQDDATFVKRLRQLGAIPFCLTNVPQTMKTYACSNPVYGCTTHPMDKTRTPGGSSGGEACLLAQGGSILGIGSDIGGSLRTPSHFCGTVALKTTSGRMLERGRRAGGTGKVIGIHSNTGFMSSSVDGVLLGMRAMLEEPLKMSALDFKVIPVPWREELFRPKRKLRIGWYDDDGYFPATPCCRRAVHEATAILSRLGHEIVPFRPPNLRDIVRFYFDHMLADSGITSLEVWEDEILDQAVETNKIVFKTPKFLRRWLLNPLMGLVSEKLADCSVRGLFETADMWKSMMKLDDAIETIFHAWQEQNLDIVICPGFTYPAPPITNPGRIVPAISYPAVYNVLDFPAGVVPVTRVTEADQAALESYPKDEDFLYKLVYQGTLGTQGFPLGVQVVGKPWDEELVLHVMKLLEDNREENFP